MSIYKQNEVLEEQSNDRNIKCNHNVNSDISYMHANIERLEKDVNNFEKDYVVFKSDMNNTLKQLTNNVTLLTKAVDKVTNIEKDILNLNNDNKYQEEKIKKIENKIDWITKLFISTILIIGLQSVYTITKDDKKTKVVYIDSNTNKVVKTNP